MATDRKTKKELENQIRDVRVQLTDQLRCLDQRVDCHLGMVWELQEYYRRHAEVETELARSLEKLDKQIRARHKAEKQKREQWSSYSTYETWQTLLNATRKRSRDHFVMAEIFGVVLVSRLGDLMEDMQRVHKKCRDVLSSYQEELIKVLNELLNAMKTYHTYYSDSQQAETKLLRVQSQRVKGEQQVHKVLAGRFRRDLDKQSEKKQAKYTENKLKALKARNDYLLAIDAANAAVNKYFNADVPMLIEKMDVGYHALLGQMTNMHVKMEECLIRNHKERLESFSFHVWNIHDPQDRDNFRSLHARVFTTPETFEFQPHRGDEICQLSAQKAVQEEMLERVNAIRFRLDENSATCQQMLQTLAATDRSLMDKISQVDDVDIPQMFQEDRGPLKSPTDRDKRKADRVEAEDRLISEVDSFLRAGNLVVRLQAKYDALQKALGDTCHDVTSSSSDYKPPSLPPKPKKKLLNPADQPKLFGGSLQEYIEKTGQTIPDIILSCVRLVNLHGMHHQGIFRISGSQADINSYKQQFEQGFDPLRGKLDGDDINSVAGLFKLYFRELKDPLFPRAIFDQLIGLSQKFNVNDAGQELEWKAELSSILGECVPQCVRIVMRYLFAFLNHVSQYSDENMMDASNLAICFGPTLLPIPDGRDQVQYQAFVNELIKNVIVHYESVLPFDGGVVYERCVVQNDTDKDYNDGMSDDDLLNTSSGAICEEEDDEESELTATAQFDFQGRTHRELSFKKGDMIILHLRKSPEWWEGSTGGNRGLIPHKYIKLPDSRGLMKMNEGLCKSTECLATLGGSTTTTLGHASSQSNLAAPGATENQPGGTSTTGSLPMPPGRRSVSPGRRSVSPSRQAKKNNEETQSLTDFSPIDNVLASVNTHIKQMSSEMNLATGLSVSELSRTQQPVVGVTKSAGETSAKTSVEKQPDLTRTLPNLRSLDLMQIVPPPKFSDEKIDDNKNVTQKPPAAAGHTMVPIFVKPPSPLENPSETSDFSSFSRGKTKAATLPKTTTEAEALKMLEGKSGGKTADGMEVDSGGVKSLLSRSDSTPEKKDGHLVGAASATFPRSMQDSQSRAVPASVPTVPTFSTAPVVPVPQAPVVPTGLAAPIPPPKPVVGKKPLGQTSPKPARPAEELKLVPNKK